MERTQAGSEASIVEPVRLAVSGLASILATLGARDGYLSSSFVAVPGSDLSFSDATALLEAQVEVMRSHHGFGGVDLKAFTITVGCLEDVERARALARRLRMSYRCLSVVATPGALRPITLAGNFVRKL